MQSGKSFTFNNCLSIDESSYRSQSSDSDNSLTLQFKSTPVSIKEEYIVTVGQFNSIKNKKKKLGTKEDGSKNNNKCEINSSYKEIFLNSSLTKKTSKETSSKSIFDVTVPNNDKSHNKDKMSNENNKSEIISLTKETLLHSSTKKKSLSKKSKKKSSESIPNVTKSSDINEDKLQTIDILQNSNIVNRKCEINPVHKQESNKSNSISETTEYRFNLYKIIQCAVNLWKYSKVNEIENGSLNNILSFVEQLIENDVSHNLEELETKTNLFLNVNLLNDNITKNMIEDKHLKMKNCILQFIFFINMSDIAFIKSCFDLKIDLSKSTSFLKLNGTYPTRLLLSSKVQEELLQYLTCDEKNLSIYLKKYFECIFNSSTENLKNQDMIELIQQSYHNYLSLEKHKLVNKMLFSEVKICNILPGYYRKDSPVPYSFNMTGKMVLTIKNADMKIVNENNLLAKEDSKTTNKIQSKCIHKKK